MGNLVNTLGKKIKSSLMTTGDIAMKSLAGLCVVFFLLYLAVVVIHLLLRVLG